jgi:hypothetical protein
MYIATEDDEAVVHYYYTKFSVVTGKAVSTLALLTSTVFCGTD